MAVNLVMRFYDVESGRILLDGIDIRALPRTVLRRQFAMVLQDTWLFHGTIRDNIAYAKPEATDEEIIRAAQAAHIDRFIRTLPDGYDTLLRCLRRAGFTRSCIAASFKVQ
ncbi:MAG: ATP-binding cassette domain-containing protein [Hydrogenibacillus sp.]|nr:ATP-binding cassette domain-containing protein [Hydrogenibacillus sp.]